MKKGNILLVDDDKGYLQLVACIFERAGIKVHYAMCGEEAIGILKKGSIATMLTDLNMPGIDGFELAMIAKELLPDIEIVMITGDISPEVYRMAAKSGIAKVLAKPVNAEDIQKIFRGKIAWQHVPTIDKNRSID